MSVEALISSTLLQDIRQFINDSTASSKRGLWLLDEHEQLPPCEPSPQLQLLTNRYDVYQRFSTAGWSISFSDWDSLVNEQGTFDVAFYRISKEKAVVHHLIQYAEQCLISEGELLLYGGKSEGLKGYYDRVKKWAEVPRLDKLGKGAMRATFSGLSSEVIELDDSDFTQLRSITELAGVPVYSKPGVFGWQKVDAGSQFLADQWQCFPEIFDAESVIDLGCGYGYLSLRFWQDLSVNQQQKTRVRATDSNAAAITCCVRNFVEHHVKGEVIAANCGDQLQQPADLILCNPPFHQGFGVEGTLTDRFLEATQQLLAPNGQALFVVNGFVPLARKAEALFAKVEVFADNGSFKLVRLAKPLGRR